MTSLSDKTRADLIATSQAIIDNRVSLIEGCRILGRLLGGSAAIDPELSAPIIAFESETDGHPVGDVRHRYAKSFLDQLDREIAEYSSRARPGIVSACRRIIEEYSL